jgi:C-terminal processing protease CtpA/Prc
LAHFEEDEQFYLVEELIVGHDLSHEIIPDKQRSEKEVITLDYQGAVEDFNQILGSQELSGIGVQTEINSASKMPTVTRVIENTPADKQGVKTGDQILAIDAKSTTNMSLEQIIKLIRGQNGTQVTLRIARGNNNLNISLTRTQIIDTKFANV